MKAVFAYYPLVVNWSHSCDLLAEICRARGIESFVLPMDEKFFGKVEFVTPEFVCFSFVTVHEYARCFPFVDAAKKTGAKVLAGGVLARKGHRFVEGLFDAVCRGEGETLPDYFLFGDDSLFQSKLEDENIDVTPWCGNVSGYEFSRGIPFFEGLKIVPYSSSRGCPYDCAFCESKFQGNKVRIKSSIKKDMKRLYELKTPELFYLLDELPPYYNPEWRDQFDGNPYPFQCYIRADISPENLDFMIRNGMRSCAFGIESGDERHRNEVLKKGLSDAQVFRTVETLNRRGIFYLPFFMVGSPGETDETRMKTEAMARTIGGYPITWNYEDLSPGRKRDMRMRPEDAPAVQYVLSKTGGAVEAAHDMLSAKGAYVLMPNDGTVFLLFGVADTVGSGHVYALPEYRGRRAIDAERDAIRWAFSNTAFETIVGFTPKNMKHVMLYHSSVGMDVSGEANGNVVFYAKKGDEKWGPSEL